MGTLLSTQRNLSWILNKHSQKRDSQNISKLTTSNKKSDGSFNIFGGDINQQVECKDPLLF